ncbi:MAG: hypothetical protein NT062_22725 [Proteobacteria bacterium]|nr:hypothetical protein [Pseudomonadota bacterium]
MGDDASWRLRHELASAAPALIAESLASPAGAHVDAAALLGALLDAAPHAVATALVGRDDDVAWALRARMTTDVVIASLGGVPGPRAWALRARWLDDQGGLDALDDRGDVALATVACAAVTGLDDDQAWAVRKAARALAPVAALESLLGVEVERAWTWRERDVERAPKTVMRTLGQSSDPRAWALRARVAAHCEETLLSIIGQGDEAAWQLREARLEAWPSSAVKSLGPLAPTTRGRALIATALARFPTDVALWRQVAIATARWDGASR